MLSRIATPRSFIPILPTMPASVSVSTRRPSGCSIVHTIQPSASSLCQSHVWIPSAEPDAVIAPRQAMVEHSPADAARSSVRAFSAAIVSTGRPDPAAMPSISVPSSGEYAAILSSACPPKRAMSAAPRPFREKSRA